MAAPAWSPAAFLAGRVLQGLGAAIIVPTGMSLLTTTSAEGPQRERALGISGTVLSLGFTIGMVLGGVLSDALGWRSTMGLLSVAGVAVLAIAPLVLTESRHPQRPRLDLPGAVTVTGGGPLALIYALSTAAQQGFGGPDVLVTLVAGGVLLAAFVRVESRAAQPLVSLPMLRRRSVAWGNPAGRRLGAHRRAAGGRRRFRRGPARAASSWGWAWTRRWSRWSRCWWAPGCGRSVRRATAEGDGGCPGPPWPGQPALPDFSYAIPMAASSAAA